MTTTLGISVMTGNWLYFFHLRFKLYLLETFIFAFEDLWNSDSVGSYSGF